MTLFDLTALLGLLDELHLLHGDGPERFEDNTKMVSDGELVVELAARTCRLDV